MLTQWVRHRRRYSWLTLYEMIDGAEAVDFNDTVKQLDKVAMFIKDQKEKKVSKNNIDSKVVSHLAKKNKVANQAAMTVERERKEVLQLEAVKGAQTEFGKLATAHRCVEREDRKSQGLTCQL